MYTIVKCCVSNCLKNENKIKHIVKTFLEICFSPASLIGFFGSDFLSLSQDTQNVNTSDVEFF